MESSGLSLGERPVRRSLEQERVNSGLDQSEGGGSVVPGWI